MLQLRDLATGDLILFDGRHRVHVRQRERTGCRWTQVALAIRLPTEPLPLIFEASQLSESIDIKSGRVIRGVQLVRSKERLETFEGQAAARILSPALGPARTARLLSFVTRTHGRSFDRSPRSAVRAYYRTNPRPDGSVFFCSHLVAEAYQRLGILPVPPDGLGANNYIPADFSAHYSGAYFPMHEHVALSEESILSW
jgi:hypothetical protein